MRHKQFFAFLRLALIALLTCNCFGVFSIANAIVPVLPENVSQHMQVQIVTDQANLQPGTKFKVGILVNLEPGWHIYWVNPGDSGEATKVDWKMPAGILVKPIQWPSPHVFNLGDVTSYGYENETLFVSIGHVTSTLTGSKEIAAHVSWILCKDECIPGETNLSVALEEGTVVTSAVRSAMFAASSTGLTRNHDISGDATLDAHSIAFKIRGAALANMRPESMIFLPESENLLKPNVPQKISIESDGAISINASPVLNFKSPAGANIPGILLASDQSGLKHAFRIYPIINAEDGSIWQSLIFENVWVIAFTSAFLGGLLLNLMPCVFPVLSLKVLALVEHAHSQDARKHTAAFVFGVMGSFLSLAGILCLFRSLGIEVGWGFQFQSTRFVAIMAICTFMLGLNLAGLFEIGLLLQNKAGSVKVSTGLTGSFMSGVLATALATPCTAPFMGSALAVALTAPMTVAFGIFTSLGLGMSSPYIILALWPKLARFLPKPGAWMETFKQALSFPMFATTVWLMAVLGAQQGIAAMTNCAIGLVLASFACWILGRWGTPYKRRSLRYGARICALVIMLISLASAVPFEGEAASKRSENIQNAENNWQPFTEARLKSLQEEGKTVLVDFTASWCLVCTVNHNRIFGREEIMKKLNQSGVTLLRADWSTKDDGITRTLRNLGKSGVPLVVLYKGATPQKQFDSLIDPDAFHEAIEEVTLVG